jgi:hypothetical protein
VLSGNWAGHEFGGVRNRGARWRGDGRRLSCPAVRPPKVATPFQFFVFLIAGWIHRRQQLAIAYLRHESPSYPSPMETPSRRETPHVDRESRRSVDRTDVPLS